MVRKTVKKEVKEIEKPNIIFEDVIISKSIKYDINWVFFSRIIRKYYHKLLEIIITVLRKTSFVKKIDLKKFFVIRIYGTYTVLFNFYFNNEDKNYEYLNKKLMELWKYD